MFRQLGHPVASFYSADFAARVLTDTLRSTTLKKKKTTQHNNTNMEVKNQKHVYCQEGLTLRGNLLLCGQENKQGSNSTTVTLNYTEGVKYTTYIQLG